MRNLFGGDPHFNNVVLQLPLRSHLRDESKWQNAVTVDGNTAIVNAAAYFDGDRDYLTVPSGLVPSGTETFTVELWVNVTNLSNTATLFRGSDNSFEANIQTSGSIKVDIAGVSNLLTTASGLIVVGGWAHIAIVRNGTDLRVYVDGKAAGSATTVHSFVAATTIFYNSFSATHDFRGYVKDLRITKGVARYTQNFNPPTYLPTHGVPALSRRVSITMPEAKRPPVLARRPALSGGDPHFNNVVLQLPLRSHLRDESKVPKTVTVNGDARLLDGATYLDGTGDSLEVAASADFAFSGSYGNFTVELRILVTSAKDAALVDMRPASTNGNYISLSITSTGSLSYYVNSGDQITTATGTIATGQWYHLAIVRYSGVTTLYVNGVATGTPWTDSTAYASNARFVIGQNTFTGTLNFQGYVRDVRITRGLARYVANFTPPTSLPTHGAAAAFTPYVFTYMKSESSCPPLLVKSNSGYGDKYFNNVVLQLPLNNYTKDESLKARAVTTYGAPILTGYGAKFDGVDDYYYLATGIPSSTRTNPFVFECWVYQNSTPNGSAFISQPYAGGTVAYALGFGSGAASGSIPFVGFYNGTWNTIQTSAAMPNGVWYHLAGGRSSATDWFLAINGVVVKRGSLASLDISSNYELFIGRRWDTSGTLSFFNGMIRDVRGTIGTDRGYSQGFTPPKLLPVRVQDSYTKTRKLVTILVEPVPTIKVFYINKEYISKYDIYRNNIVYDIKSDTGVIEDKNKNVITLYNMSINYNYKPFGASSMQFNGSNSYFTTAGINFWGGEKTIDGYLYCIGGAGANITSSLIYGEGQYYWGLGINSSNQLNLYYWTGSQANLTSSLTVPLNKWVHFAITYSNTTVSCYIDGIRYILGTSFSPTPPTGLSYSGGGNGSSTYFNGYIKNIRLTNAVRYNGPIFIPPSEDSII